MFWKRRKTESSEPSDKDLLISNQKQRISELEDLIKEVHSFLDAKWEGEFAIIMMVRDAMKKIGKEK